MFYDDILFLGHHILAWHAVDFVPTYVATFCGLYSK